MCHAPAPDRVGGGAACLAGVRARCPRCGYDLAATMGERCPECGTALELRLTEATGHAGLRYAALAGSLVTLVMLLVCLVGVMEKVLRAIEDPAIAMRVRASVAPASDLPNWSVVIAFALAVSAAAGLVGVVVGWRHRGRGWCRGLRWIVSGFACVSPVAAVLVMRWLG